MFLTSVLIKTKIVLLMAYLPPFLYGYGYDGYGSGYESGNNDNGSSGLFDNDGPSTTDKLYILTRDKVLIDSIQVY